MRMRENERREWCGMKILYALDRSLLNKHGAVKKMVLFLHLALLNFTHLSY